MGIEPTRLMPETELRRLEALEKVAMVALARGYAEECRVELDKMFGWLRLDASQPENAPLFHGDLALGHFAAAACAGHMIPVQLRELALRLGIRTSADGEEDWDSDKPQARYRTAVFPNNTVGGLRWEWLVFASPEGEELASGDAPSELAARTEAAKAAAKVIADRQRDNPERGHRLLKD